MYTRKKHPLTIAQLVDAAQDEHWHYLSSLNLTSDSIQQVSYAQIMENPGDVAMGVNAVEVLFDRIFFDVFDGLVIKHHLSGEILMMFYTDNASADQVEAIYSALRNELGGGTLMDHKFSSFKRENIVRVANGEQQNEKHEIVQAWLDGQFSYVLNYKLDPAKQLLFNFSWSPERSKDSKHRNKGTLIPYMTHAIDEILQQKETALKTTNDAGSIKFIDYSFDLQPPEFGIFEKAVIRIFSPERKLDPSVQCHLTYYSAFEVDTPSAIKFCDQLIGIYGPDDLGSRELEPHELDNLDDSEHFRGRTWTLNTRHGIYDLTDESQSQLYQLRLSSDPQEHGFSLHVGAFNRMLDYEEIIVKEAK